MSKFDYPELVEQRHMDVMDAVKGIDLARLRELAEAEREGKIKIGSDWTPCAEGTNLPRFGETVLVTVEFESGSRIVFQAYRKCTLFGSWYWMYTTGNRCWLKVIAWQPLPEPYNPDRKEERQ